MKLSFVGGNSLNMDVGLFGDTWCVHGKWLTYEGSHEDVYYDVVDPSEDATFNRDHVVLQLREIMIDHLKATEEHAETGLRGPFLRSMANGRVRQMPRSVRCTPTYKRSRLHVSWKSEHTRQNDSKVVNVVLHNGTCEGGPCTKGRRKS